MSSRRPAADPSQLAVMHHAGQLWDAQRGLFSAYAVDRTVSHEAIDFEAASVPAWDQLSLEQQAHFSLSARFQEGVALLCAQVLHVMEVGQ